MKKDYNQYESFKKYRVEADSIEDFLKKYTKHNKYEEPIKGYVECRIKSFYEEFKKHGFCFITHHDSVTGEIVAYFG